MATTTLREFVIRLGFKVESSQERNFNESMQKTAKGALDIVRAFGKIGAATVAGMAASGFAIHKVAEGLAGLYYSAQRTGSSARELKVLEYGFQQIGLSAEQARGSVEALAAARRQNPGLNGILAGLGIDPKQLDNSKVFTALLAKMRTMRPFIRAQYAAMFGLDEGVINQVELNGPQFASALKRREEIFKKLGFDPDKAAREGLKLTRQWNDASATYQTLFEKTAVKLLPVVERFIPVLERIADWLGKTDKATSGWVTSLGALAMALTPILAALKVSGGLGLIGKGAGALLKGLGGLGAGEAAAGGAEAAGGGLLATLGLPALIATVVIAAVAYLATHPEQVKKAWEWTKTTAQKAADDLKGGFSALKGAAKSSGGYVNALKEQPGFIGDLARMVGKFEGFRDRIYKDVAGNATFGFGHKLQPGENVQGVNPLSLFMGDLQKSLWAVARNVKVRLTGNQRKALADLEFNIGEKNFKDSTLVKLLNQGKYDEAADQFARWNKVLVNGHHVANATLSQRRAAEAQLFRTPDSKTLNLQTSIKIEDGGNARETARETGHEQKRVYGDIIRNFQPAHS